MSRDNAIQKYDFDYSPSDVNRGRRDERRPNERPRPRTSDYMPSSRGSVTTYLNVFLKFSFFTVVFVLFSFVFLIVLQTLGFNTFSFLPDDGGIFSVPLLPTNRQVIFSNRRMAASEPTTFKYLVPIKYTVSLDVYIKSDFVEKSIPRVLLYSSANEAVLTATDTSIAKIILKMPQTNFVLYLDPYNNDLNAIVICQASATAATTVATSGGPSGIITSSGPSGPSGARPTAEQNESDADIMQRAGIKTISIPPIKNVPIRTPFRITMMLSDVLLELYINGDLQKSIPFNGNILRVVPANTQFYGPPGIVGMSVPVSNISYWNTPLSSKSIRVYGKEPINSSVFAT